MQATNEDGKSLLGILLVQGLKHDQPIWDVSANNKFAVKYVSSGQVDWHKQQYKEENGEWNMTPFMIMLSYMTQHRKKDSAINSEIFDKAEIQ